MGSKSYCISDSCEMWSPCVPVLEVKPPANEPAYIIPKCTTWAYNACILAIGKLPHMTDSTILSQNANFTIIPTCVNTFQLNDSALLPIFQHFSNPIWLPILHFFLWLVPNTWNSWDYSTIKVLPAIEKDKWSKIVIRCSYLRSNFISHTGKSPRSMIDTGVFN